jgi:tRNA(Arg) A34 adenosine deaminase TadA
MINKQNLARAINKAQQTTCRYKVFAIGFNSRGDIIGIASNRRRFDREGGSIHAEMELIKNYGRKIRSIIIGRTNSSGNLLPIDCCDACKKILDRYRITVRTVL